MQSLHPTNGWLEVISGSMFSGKSEELIRRLRRAEIARQTVQIFKPALDTRYGADHIVSHSQMRLRSELVDTTQQLLERVRPETSVVGVDEAQFFDRTLIEVVNELACSGKRVIVAGLDLDYRGLPFGPMPELMATAEYVSKQLAICMVCGAPANFTQRLTSSHEQIEIGAAGMYEARCRQHFQPPPDDRDQTEDKDVKTRVGSDPGRPGPASR